MTDVADRDEDPGSRGSLQVADRVIDRIATHSATGVAGVVVTGGTLGKLVGRRLPKAASEIHGDRVRVSVDIAVAWPLDVADVAATVRRDVARAVTDLAGMRVLGVDVSVAALEHPTSAPRRRVQ